MRSVPCPDCRGQRLNPRARAVRVAGTGRCPCWLDPIGQVRRFMAAPGRRGIRRGSAGGAHATPLDDLSRTIAEELLKEIRGAAWASWSTWACTT